MRTLGPDFSRQVVEVAQMEAAAYIYVNANGGDGSKWKSLSLQSQAKWVPEGPGAFLAEQTAWSAATREFMPETDEGPLRDRVLSCSKNQRQLLWLLVRVIPDLFSEILPDIQHVKQELEPSRSTGAFAVRRPLQATAAVQASSSVKPEPVPATSAVQASSSVKPEPVPATAALQASSSVKPAPVPATSALQASSSTKSDLRSLPSPLRVSGHVKQESEEFYEDLVAQFLQPYVWRLQWENLGRCHFHSC